VFDFQVVEFVAFAVFGRVVFDVGCVVFAGRFAVCAAGAVVDEFSDGVEFFCSRSSL
jgi:hypothetical protein